MPPHSQPATELLAIMGLKIRPNFNPYIRVKYAFNPQPNWAWTIIDQPEMDDRGAVASLALHAVLEPIFKEVSV